MKEKINNPENEKGKGKEKEYVLHGAPKKASALKKKQHVFAFYYSL